MARARARKGKGNYKFNNNWNQGNNWGATGTWGKGSKSTGKGKTWKGGNFGKGRWRPLGKGKGKGKGKGLGKSKGKNSTSTPLCYNCGKPGHLAATCWAKKDAMDVNAINATDYCMAWDEDTQQYWVFEPEVTQTEVTSTTVNAIKAGYFMNDSDWTWDNDTGMMWTYNAHTDEWISEEAYQAALNDSLPAATPMSINYVWDEDNETYWIVWDPDVTVTSADGTTPVTAIYVTPQATEGQETWTIEVVRLLNWEDFAEPDITVECLDDVATDHCSFEAYTLDDTGSITSDSDCDILLDYDFNENCKATATWFDFGLLWTWMILLLNSWTSGFTFTGCSLFCYVNLSGLVKVTGYAKLTVTG